MQSKHLSAALLTLPLLACSGTPPATQRHQSPCDDKPRCVSTLDARADYALAPFKLTPDTTLAQIEPVALSLPGAALGEKQQNYLRIEYSSKVLGYVDDMELFIEGDTLQLRSEARLGYYDFGVNRDRAEALRSRLTEAGLVMP